MRISSWRIWSVYTSVPDIHAHCTHQFLTDHDQHVLKVLFKFGIYVLKVLFKFVIYVLKVLFKFWNFYAYSEHTHKKLMRMLWASVSSWCVCSATHQFPTPMLRIWISLWCLCSACFKGPALLKIRLSICVGNFAALNEPLNIKKNFIGTPKSPSQRDFMV